MPSPVVYKVLTEFKFETGSALLNATSLQGAVDNLSKSADNALLSFQSLSSGFAAQLGLFGGGVLGVLSSILNQFNKIEETSIKFGGIIFANRQFLDGITNANDALGLTKNILKDISKDAAKFGLNESSLAQITALTAGTVVKEGVGIGQARQFARNTLKAAPQLGIDAFEAQGQIQRALLGGASLGDPAFKALVSETTVFKERFKDITKVTKEFNALPLKERFQLLNTGFAQFTSNAELLAAQADTVNAMIMRVKQGLFGLNGVFKPLGDIVSGPVKEALRAFLKFIGGDLKNIIKNLSDILRQTVPSLETMIIRLQEIRDLSKNMKAAGVGALVLQLLPLIGLLKYLKNTGLFTFVAGGLRAIFGAIGGSGAIWAGLGRLIGFAISSLKQFLKPFLLLLGIFQILSRAAAIGKIEDAKKLPGIMNSFLETTSRLTAGFSIFFEGLDKAVTAIATKIAPFFEWSTLLDPVAKAFKELEMWFNSFLATLSGGMTVLGGWIDSIKNMRFGELLDPNRNISMFEFGMNNFLENLFKRSGQSGPDEMSTSGTTIIHNGDNIIRNEFKEQMEPDRIAFTLVDQLQKLAQNPTQARGRAFIPVGASSR